MSPPLPFVAIFLVSAGALKGRAAQVQREGVDYDHNVDLPTTRPLVVAHRGSSGTVPEHTVTAYRLAVDQGADVVECDLTVSNDLVLLCSHEAWISDTTDIADRYPPSRVNTYFVPDQMRNITDYFTVDFTMDELRQVRKRQRQSFRDPSYDGQLPIASLEDLVTVVKAAGRPVGIYVETKDTRFINSLPIVKDANTTFEDLLLAALRGFGYDDARSPCFLQSFSEDSLRYMADRSPLPAVMLLPPIPISDDALARYAVFAYGIGPDKRAIVRVNSSNHIVERTDFVERAHRAGLRVHPYTLRNENQYLAWDYGQDPYNEYDDFFKIGVDGIFTDFPATYFKFMNNTYLALSSSGSEKPTQLSLLLTLSLSVTSLFAPAFSLQSSYFRSV